MTAMNAFAREDGAWLLADTGVYDHAGRIVCFASKVAPCERLSLAIGISGRQAEGCICDIEAWLGEQPDQLAALARLPRLVEILRNLDAEAQANGALIGNALPRKGFA